MTDKIEQYEYLFKILLVGTNGVGKSSLIDRYIGSQSDGNKLIGVEFKGKNIVIEDKKVRLQIWNLNLGDTTFHLPSYCKGANGIIIMYDITSRDSFYDIEKWMNEINKIFDKNVIKMIVGNKSDLKEFREVDKKLVDHYSKQIKVDAIETSAKVGTNVDNVFMDMAKKLLTIALVDKNIDNVLVDSETKGIIRIEKPKNNNRCILL